MGFIEKKVIDTVRARAADIARELGVELYDVTYRREPQGRVLRVTIDSEAGGSLDACESMSRQISAWLDEDESVIPHDKYELEVSTPGLDRPLRSAAEFAAHAGKLCRISLNEKMADGRKRFTGRIVAVEGDAVRIHVEKESQEFVLPVSNIAKANLEVEL